MSEILSFALLVFIASFTPGPNNSMLLRSGLLFGFQRTLPHIGGIVLGFSILFQSIRLGLAQLFVQYPQILLAVKLIGSLYFLYIAWKMLQLSERNTPQTRSQAERPRNQEKALAKQPFPFGNALLFQWVNVKAWMFAISANSAMPYQQPKEFVVFFIVLFFTISSATSWTLLGQALKKLFSKPLYSRAISIGLALSLLYVVFSWWQVFLWP